MQLIRCTQKLLEEMAQQQEDLTIRGSDDSSLLGSWHADLIYIDRRKCLLFVNDKTLFNFLIPDVPRRQIREMDKLFLGFLQCILSDEGFDQSIKDDIQSEYRELGYAKTSSKRVLSSMNELAFHYKLHVQAEGGVYRCNLPEIIRKMNRVPMSAIEQVYAIKALKALFGIETKPA